jgi:hypothetical protein
MTPDRAFSASPLLIAAPTRAQRRPYLLRVAVAVFLIFAATVLVLSIKERWFATNGLGSALYWLHDSIYLPLKGHFWTRLFPTGTMIWLGAAVVLLLLMLPAYFAGLDMMRTVQIKIVSVMLEQPRRMAALLQVYKIGRRLRLRGDLIRAVAHDHLAVLLEHVRGKARHWRSDREERRHIFQTIDFAAALDQATSSPSSHATLEYVSAFFMTLQPGSSDATDDAVLQAELYTQSLRTRLISLTTTLDPSLGRLVARMLDLVFMDKGEAQKAGMAEIRRYVADRTTAIHQLASRLDWHDASSDARSEAPTSVEALAIALLAAAFLGLRDNADIPKLRTALAAIVAMERLALAATLCDSSAPESQAGANAICALILTDARLHAAVMAQRIEQSTALVAGTWHDIAPVYKSSRATDLAVAAASEPPSSLVAERL